MDYRKKDEFMECIAQCFADDGDFDCYINCDRFVIISLGLQGSSMLNYSQVHSWLGHNSNLRDPQWWDADWTVQHVR